MCAVTGRRCARISLDDLRHVREGFADLVEMSLRHLGLDEGEHGVTQRGGGEGRVRSSDHAVPFHPVEPVLGRATSDTRIRAYSRTPVPGCAPSTSATPWAARNTSTASRAAFVRGPRPRGLRPRQVVIFEMASRASACALGTLLVSSTRLWILWSVRSWRRTCRRC